MRISDWSSDVCSSDLGAIRTFIGGRFPGWVWFSVLVFGRGRRRGRRGGRAGCARPADSVRAAGHAGAPFLAPVLVGVFVQPADRRNRATPRAQQTCRPAPHPCHIGGTTGREKGGR